MNVWIKCIKANGYTWTDMHPLTVIRVHLQHRILVTHLQLQ